MHRPVLVLQGERDYQVTRADFELWQQALRANPAAKLELYPDLNHVFMSGTGPASPGEYLQPGHVSEAVVRDIADFAASVTPRAPAGR